MPTSRFLRAAVRTRTVAGTTSVGGTNVTVVSIMADGTIRFVDRNGVQHDVQVPAHYTGGFKNMIQPSSQNRSGDPRAALYALVDALIARA